MKRVLVTGATGFIGRQSLPFLLELGFEVHALFTKAPIDVDERILWHQGDLLSENDAKDILERVAPTHLLHFAWYVNPKDYKTSSENERWVQATNRLLHAFRHAGGTRAVLAGTCMEYDPELRDTFLKEDAQTENHNAYATAKNRTHTEADSFARENDMSLAWGRIFNLYGPFEAKERLVPQVVAALREGNSPNIAAGGLILDYSYVKDTAAAFVALLDSSVTGSVNIASGEALSLHEMANVLARLMDKYELVADLNDKVPETGSSRVVADVTRLRNEVAWSPRYSLRDGLQETIIWLEKNGS